MWLSNTKQVKQFNIFVSDYKGDKNVLSSGYCYSPREPVKHYHYDRLGSVSSISLDKPGLAEKTFEYGPFGQLLKGKHSWDWEHKGAFQKDSDTIGFTGKKIDSESGNCHFPFIIYLKMKVT